MPPKGGRREERVPRHGSAAPGADVESVHDAPRGSSMAGWSIRRKLAVLVTIPLVVLLVGGGVLVASLTVQYQQTRTASTYADAILPALGTARAFDSEFNNPSALTEPTALARARASTDTQIRQLRPYLETLSEGDPNESNLPNTAQNLLGLLATLPNIRSAIDKQIQSGAFKANNNPKDVGTTVSQVNSNTQALRSAAQDMISTLTGELSVVS